MRMILSLMMVLSMQHSQNTSQKETIKIRKDKQIIEGYWLYNITLFRRGYHHTKFGAKDIKFFFKKNGTYTVSKKGILRNYGEWEIMDDSLLLTYNISYPDSSIASKHIDRTLKHNIGRIEFRNDTLVVHSIHQEYGPIQDCYIRTNKF